MFILLLVILPVGVGIIFYIISNSPIATRKPLWISLLVFFAIVLQITLHPVESPGWSPSNNTWVKSYEYIDVYYHYPDDVQYDDLAFGNEAQRIAASIKCKELLPDGIVVLQIEKKIGTSGMGGPLFDWENPERQFYLEKRNGAVRYDKNQFDFEQREDGLWLIINPNSPDPIEYFFTEREFNISKQFTPYSNVSWHFGDYAFTIYYQHWLPETGAGELLYKSLSLK